MTYSANFMKNTRSESIGHLASSFHRIPARQFWPHNLRCRRTGPSKLTRIAGRSIHRSSSRRAVLWGLFKDLVACLPFASGEPSRFLGRSRLEYGYWLRFVMCQRGERDLQKALRSRDPHCGSVTMRRTYFPFIPWNHWIGSVPHLVASDNGSLGFLRLS